MPLSKGSVLITGCSDGGIGSALAAAFAQHGFHVFATARTTQSMSHLKDNGNITLLTLDVVDAKQIKDAAETVKSQTGGTLDYLVSNAGHNRFMPLLDEDIEEAKRLYDINCWGPLQLVQTFSPLLIQAKGTVVFIASVSGYMNVPWQGVYAASKRSVEILGDNLRLELAPFDVKVVSVVTTAVESQNHTHYQEWKMPDNSRYKSVEEHFIKRAKGDDGSPRMPNQKYAEGVVNKLLANPGPKFWYGAFASLIKFGSSWFPTSWLVS
ncbi:putative hydroxybutyrate dehydrogenase [Corynespora cassiicola Philippines]|uniref:Putative hydroxybutyrate dehydrogenase n=1 Tax=Corynespora cassiicola Philippines TaxID=1448308 RepID=A0A2T2NJ77_CORCC|nr:putative hydroxybutyrate dehydrogenase [Corynespora cassiicola Philippines]